MDDRGGAASELAAGDYVRTETLDRIRHFLLRPQNSAYTDLKGLCDRVSDSYRNRVVLELLQNAHDAHDRGRSDGRVKFLLDPDDGPFGTLSVANDGRSFTQKDFDALCSPSRTTKPVNDAIGNKGVGFLSVFQVCDHPEVYSRRDSHDPGFNGFCFRFSDKATVAAALSADGIGNRAEEVLAGMPRLYLALPLELQSKAVGAMCAEGFSTVVRLPLKGPKAFEAVAEQLEILNGGPPVQLFLDRIAALTIERSGRATVSLARKVKVLFAQADLRLFEVGCGEDKYVLAQRALPESWVKTRIQIDVAAGRLPDAWLGWEGDAVVSLAVAAEGRPLKGRLYNFLPMGEQASAPLPGHLDAPFYASINRLELQANVGLNEAFLQAAQALAVDASRETRRHLSGPQARQVAVDLLLWRDERDAVLSLLTASGDAPVPVLARGDPSWAVIGEARIWNGDEVMTPQLAARVTRLAIVDPALGSERIQALVSFLALRHSLACSTAERAEVAEQIARDMHRRGRPLPRWNDFYRSLAKQFHSEPAALAGRGLLLTQRGELVAAGAGQDLSKGRRKRLSAVFLPPLRGASNAAALDLPRAVSRRLAYVDAGLEIAREATSAARRFLLAGGLVRDHESREILRMLAAAMSEPGDVKDPEALRWAALLAMKQIITAEDTAEGVVLELPVLAPTKDGWVRANTVYFSERWTGEGSRELQRLFDEAAGLSAELDSHASRLLRPFASWPAGGGSRDGWVAFLRKAGVVDHLRPVSAFGLAPRADGNVFAATLASRAGLPPEQARCWTQLLKQQIDLPNPLTLYTVSGAQRLPGQVDFAALAPVVGRAYALQVIRALETYPRLHLMDVYRPSDHHRMAQNRRAWPSPTAAFLCGAKWLPLADGQLGAASATWLPGSAATLPPRLPFVDHAVVNAIARQPAAAETFRWAGLSTYGDRAHAWRFLAAAAALASDLSPREGERMLAAAHESWLQVSLENVPSDLTVLGRKGAGLVAVPLNAPGNPVLVADGDDRQLVAALMRDEPELVVFDPPRGRAVDVGKALERQFPGRVRRAALISIAYESGCLPVTFSTEVPFIEDELGPGLREVLTLSLRYKNSFYHGNHGSVLERLAQVRLRWLPDLQIRIGDRVQPAMRFAERAVLLADPRGPSLLVATGLRGTERLLGSIAEALGEALGARRQIGEPLQAFAAQLRPDPLRCGEREYAEVLEVSAEEVRGVLASSRAAVAGLVRTLRPIVVLYAGSSAAAIFAPGGDLANEDDVKRALEAIEPSLPADATELLERGRLADLRAMAVGLRLDLAALNQTLDVLGAPYSPIDLTDSHRASLAAFLARKDPAVRESIRRAYQPAFDKGADLAPYVAAREAPRPALPSEFGLTHIELPQPTMSRWLEDWMAARGVEQLAAPVAGRESLEAVQEANRRRLRVLAPTLRAAVLARAAPEDPLRTKFASLPSTEAALVSAGMEGGWCDFERLDDDAALRWIGKTGLWPVKWSATVTGIALSDKERATVAKRDEEARVAAITRRRVIEFSGGSFTVGVDSLGALADRISGLVAGNAALLATSTRTVRGVAPILRRRSPGAPGEGPGPQNPPPPRLSDDEREVIGFFGEAIAFDWLKRRFGSRRVVDLSCWKSRYRRHVTNGDGDDGLGYDFEIRNGGTVWYFEVKATKAESSQARHMIELGSSEIAHAEVCRADKRSRYRVVYVVDALHPDKARIFVLPNPRSVDGEGFYAEPSGTGVRLLFPLPPAR